MATLRTHIRIHRPDHDVHADIGDAGNISAWSRSRTGSAG
jgi:hypothetical protein